MSEHDDLYLPERNCCYAAMFYEEEKKRVRMFVFLVLKEDGEFFFVDALEFSYLIAFDNATLRR